MGSFSRANPRYFLPAGLILASLVMLFMGFVPWATSSIMVMFVLLFLCGWFQGMVGLLVDVPWCTGGHRKNVAVSFLSGTVHNVGGGLPPLLFLLGMAWFNDWKAALYASICGNLSCNDCIRINARYPQSCGLPSIEEYKNDYPPDYKETDEQELTAKEIFMKYVFLTNFCG